MFLLSLRMCLLRKKSQNEGVRGMATLKAISIRLKSVKNIQKITQSMKMVSAAKFSRAERDLRPAKPLGEKSNIFFSEVEQTEGEKPAETKKNVLYVAVTSDRGLSGAVHSSVAKVIRSDIKETSDYVKIVCIGDKSRSILQRLYSQNFLFVCQEVGRTPPTFQDASVITNEILNTEFEYDMGKIVYNRFRSVVSYVTEEFRFYNLGLLSESSSLKKFDDLDSETLLSFFEFSLLALVYCALKEGACSEQSSRMTAMDNASKNAGEMISKLTLTFNRTRQAVITRELIEIISGASAL